MALSKNVGASSGAGSIVVGQEFYAQMYAVANQLITDYGMAASLRNIVTGVLRPCTVAVINYAPRDPQTLLANPLERTILFAPNLGDAPDNENEQLQTYIQPPANPLVINELLSFKSPVKLFSPGGLVVLYQADLRL